MSEETWRSYSKSWSQPEDTRNAILAALTTPDVTYTDPNVTLSGQSAFSAYMAGFQAQFPGTEFEMVDVREHHLQSLANWKLVDGEGHILMRGTSHARLAEDGRFTSINGFF